MSTFGWAAALVKERETSTGLDLQRTRSQMVVLVPLLSQSLRMSNHRTPSARNAVWWVSLLRGLFIRASLLGRRSRLVGPFFFFFFKGTVEAVNLFRPASAYWLALPFTAKFNRLFSFSRPSSRRQRPIFNSATPFSSRA